MQKRKGPFSRRLWNNAKRYYKRHGFFKSLLAFGVLLTFGAGAALAGFVTLVWMGFFGSVPTREHLKDIHHPIASEVYSVDSVLLGRYFLQDRSPVQAEDLPDNLKHALVSTEDIRFYEHDGVDVQSLFRVLIKTLL